MQEYPPMKLIVTRSQPRPGASALLGGIGIGAALMYYLDPARGARRRGLLRDQLTHAARVASEAAGTTSRDFANRARGIAAEVRALGSTDEADDDVLVQRVRAVLGRTISHPSAIEVTADGGEVTLSGDILASEVDQIIKEVEKVRGVTQVNNALVTFETADGIPSLQGGVRKKGDEFELRQENWSPAARLLTSVAGGALAFYAARRHDRFGSALGLAGLALLTRGLSNRELTRVVGVRGGRNAIRIQKTVNIAAPVDKVFSNLTDWDKFPQWMSHVREVRVYGDKNSIGTRTHWEVDGPAGSTVAWDAVVTRFIPNELVAWKSVEGEPVRQAGRIRFQPNEDGSTRVHVELQYNPPAGYIGHAIAALFKKDPKRQMDDDLARLKTLLETGRPARDAAAHNGASEAIEGLGVAG